MQISLHRTRKDWQCESSNFPCGSSLQRFNVGLRVLWPNYSGHQSLLVIRNQPLGLSSQYGCPIRFGGLMSSIVVLSTKVDIFIRAVAALATPEIISQLKP